MSISLNEFEKAIKSLEEVTSMPKNDLVRDAAIQRFEFTFELAWKVSRKIMGTNSTAPKQVIREMADNSLINDINFWFKSIDDRNLTSHTYNEDLAEQVYQTAKLFAIHARQLFEKLKLR